MNVAELGGAIIADKCKVLVKTDKIVVKLRKEKAERWADLKSKAGPSESETLMNMMRNMNVNEAEAEGL